MPRSPLFSQFPLHERLLKALESLSFSEPTPVQAAAIPKALEGHDLRKKKIEKIGRAHV